MPVPIGPVTDGNGERGPDGALKEKLGEPDAVGYGIDVLYDGRGLPLLAAVPSGNGERGPLGAENP